MENLGSDMGSVISCVTWASSLVSLGLGFLICKGHGLLKDPFRSLVLWIAKLGSRSQRRKCWRHIHLSLKPIDKSKQMAPWMEESFQERGESFSGFEWDSLLVYYSEDTWELSPAMVAWVS